MDNEHETIQEEVVNILKLLRSVITNFRIYPPGSKMVENPANELYNFLQTYLAKDKNLTIARTQTNLLVNGKKLVKEKEGIRQIGEDLSKTLLEHNIDSMTFKEGITRQELLFVVENFSRRKEQIRTKAKIGSLAKLVEETGITSVIFNEIVYVQMTKGQPIPEPGQVVVKPGTEITQAMKTLRESYEAIDTIPDENQKKDFQQNIIQQFADLEPTVIREILDNPLPEKIESSGFKQSLLSSLSKEKIENIFNEITNWYQEIQTQAESDFAALERLESLKGFITKLLTSPTSKEVSFKLYEQLLNLGLINEIPEWVRQEKQGMALVFQVDTLLEKNSLVLLESPNKENFTDMVKKLCQSELNDYAAKLTTKMAENLKNSSSPIRFNTVKLLANVFDTLVTARREDVLKNLQQQFIEELKEERETNIYREVADLLIKRVSQLMLDNEYETVLEIVTLFKIHYHTENVHETMRPKLARETLETIAKRITDFVIADLRAYDVQRQQYAIYLVSKFEDLLAQPLIKFVRTTEDLRLRKIVVNLLWGIGDNTKEYLLSQLSSDTPAEEFKRVLETLTDYVKEETVLKKVMANVNYPDPQIRILVLQFLSKINLAVIQDILLDKLNDTDESVVKETIRIIGELRIPRAIENLLKIAENQNPKIKEEICNTLGTISDNVALPWLIRIAKNSGGFFQKGENNQVRLRAILAIANIGGKQAQHILKELTKDKNSYIRKAAEESLTGTDRI